MVPDEAGFSPCSGVRIDDPERAGFASSHMPLVQASDHSGLCQLPVWQVHVDVVVGANAPDGDYDAAGCEHEVCETPCSAP